MINSYRIITEPPKMSLKLLLANYKAGDKRGKLSLYLLAVDLGYQIVLEENKIRVIKTMFM